MSGMPVSHSGAGHNWPPLLWFLCGLVLSVVLAFSIPVQMLTSESWFMHIPVELSRVLYPYVQAWLFVHQELPADQIAPFMFAFGVQVALGLFSFGIELPPHPKWRYYGCWILMVLLVLVNSAGDFASTSDYGFWGQAGFTAAILFLTFVVQLVAIMCFINAWKMMHHP